MFTLTGGLIMMTGTVRAEQDSAIYLAATGGLAGALIGLGIPEYEAKRYEGKIKGGSALISVHTVSSEAIVQAKKIFEQAHAEDISSTGESSV
jgi:hypothetical protein